ncbi:hypothetical protein ACFYYR_16805 [Streptomyces sp. NPDC001922]|uniref:hypothetical protein n=1 Tax=Streptomyces sp. NPDC001922 TaxID=3364624 RepID=UPI0036B6C725
MLRKRMDDWGLTQAELADRMNREVEQLTGGFGTFTERTVYNLLSGATAWPQAKTRRALMAVFGCTCEELGFRRPTPGAAETRPELRVKRRTFIVTTGAVAASGSLHRIGVSDLARLQREFDALVADDDRNGGGEALERRSLAFAQRAMDLQKTGSASERIRSGLYQLAAAFTSTAMWAAVDAHRPDQAQRHLERAVTLAGLSGDSAIQYRIWSHAAILALQRKRWPEASAAATVARSAAVVRREPAFASLIHARSAGINATTGDRTAALRSLAFAESAWERTRPDGGLPSWMEFYDRAELDGLSTIAHLRMGNAAQAEAHAHRALSAIRPQLERNRVYYTAYLALAQLGQGDVELACDTAATALSHPSGRTSIVLAEFDATLARTCGDADSARRWREFRRDTERSRKDSR